MRNHNRELLSLLPIAIYGDKILRKKARKVSDIDFDTIELIKNMFETMRNAYGIGLAANQIGVDKQIFVIDISVVEGYEKIKPIVFINPIISEVSEKEVIYEEGCLSIPDLHSEILRPEKILIKYYDADFKEHNLEADKLLARVIQHEFDHLKGILFTDHLDDENKKELKKELEAIRKRKIEFTYPVSENVDYILHY